MPTQNHLDAYKRVISDMRKQLVTKGSHAFASSHETYGIIAEEMLELLQAIHAKGTISQKREAIYGELSDIAVAAIHGMASIDQKDWL